MIKRNKVFLSDSHEESGSICWVVQTDKDHSMSIFQYAVTASVSISDCNKTIHLDFDCEKVKHIDKRIDKVDTLIAELTKVKDALVEAKGELTKRKGWYY